MATIVVRCNFLHSSWLKPKQETREEVKAVDEVVEYLSPRNDRFGGCWLSLSRCQTPHTGNEQSMVEKKRNYFL